LVVAPGLAKSYIGGMSASHRDPVHGRERDIDRQARLAREAEMIAEARAQAARGEVVDFEDVEAWIESWDTPQEKLRPRPRPRST
jgi:predicted transcriptional regulator